MLYALGIVMVLTIAGLITAKLVVTDREAIHATVIQIARDVKNNNHKAVLQHIYSGAPELRQKAGAELPNYQFTECRVTKINSIEVDPSAVPHSAIVEFNVIASGTFKQPGFELTDTIPRWVKLQLLREKDGRWTVAAYEHDNPQRMIMRQPGER